MSYYVSKIIDMNFEEAISKVTEELSKEGFGILSDIDVKATLKKKLDYDIKPYRILGACNPPFARKALVTENKIGTMLPCNVIVRQTDDNKIEVAAVDPVASMQAVKNRELEPIAHEVKQRLSNVIAAI
jgi:uncharacterized protein (DUF302 family)